MSKISKVTYIGLFTGFVAQVVSAQSITGGGPFGGGNIDAGRIFVDAVDAITYFDVMSVPDAGIFLGILALIYAAELNIFTEAFIRIDEIIQEALGDENRYRSVYEDEDEYPTGVKLMALATAYVTTNGVWGLFGYFSILLLSTFALLALIVTSWKLIPWGSSDEEGSDDGSGGDGGSDGGSDGGGSSSNISISDVQQAGAAALDTWDTMQDRRNKAQESKAVSNIDVGENILTLLLYLNDDTYRRPFSDYVNDLISELEQEEKVAKDEMTSIPDRTRKLTEILEEAHQRRQSEPGGPPFNFDGSQMQSFLDNLYSDDQAPFQQMRKIKNQLERLISLQKSFETDFEDGLDDNLQVIKYLYRVSMFIAEAPYSIEEMYTGGKAEEMKERLEDHGAKVTHSGPESDLDMFRKQLKQFDNQRDDYRNIIRRLKKVIEEEMKIEAKEMRWFAGAFKEGSDLFNAFEQYERDLSDYRDPGGATNLSVYQDNCYNKFEKEIGDVRNIVEALHHEANWWRGGVYKSDMYKSLDRLVDIL